MRIDLCSNVILNEDDVVAGLYSGSLTPDHLGSLNIDDIKVVDQLNNSISLNADNIKKVATYIADLTDVESFDEARQQNWMIPDEYKEFPIVEWLYEQCSTDKERDRVGAELELFVQHDMYEVLLCLKYLVDFMRKNNIVWGLGRGSSVASYCLYLIGIHKVNSLVFDLDITEFLK